MTYLRPAMATKRVFAKSIVSGLWLFRGERIDILKCQRASCWPAGGVLNAQVRSALYVQPVES